MRSPIAQFFIVLLLGVVDDLRNNLLNKDTILELLAAAPGSIEGF